MRTRLIVLAAGTVGIVGAGAGLATSPAKAQPNPPQCADFLPCPLVTIPKVTVPTVPKVTVPPTIRNPCDPRICNIGP